MHVYETVAAELRSWGALSAATFVDVQRDKERKRARELSKESSSVLRAIVQLEDKQRMADMRQKRVLDQARQRRLELADVCRNITQARKTLKEQKLRILDAEATLHVRQQVRRFSPDDLGHSRRNCGGALGKKNRLEVLKRMAGLGAGLSASQKMEFSWFCDAWDAAGIEDFGDEWPDMFSVWIQTVVEEHENAVVTAFSSFVYSETTRRLSGAVALALPALLAP